MPAKNVVKHYDAPAYYHVYNRGVAGRQLFFNDHDREKFLSLLERHIVGPAEGSTEIYRQYDVEVVAYCLMSNHFHLLLFQEYAMYFNRRHRSRGHLFQEIYRASPVSDDAYLVHISRYIHLNPAKYLTYQWSSLPEYLAARQTEWVSPDRVLDMTPEQYRSFLEDYSDRLELLKSFDDELAF